MDKDLIQNLESDSLQKLQDYQQRGFVFHGTGSADITEFIPRLASDVDQSKSFNNDNAVFAALNPVASVIFACFRNLKIPEGKGGTWSLGPNGKGEIVANIPVAWRDNFLDTYGYVYVLEGHSFSHDPESPMPWQVKSKVAIVPTDKVLVRFADFEKLGGLIVWEE